MTSIIKKGNFWHVLPLFRGNGDPPLGGCLWNIFLQERNPPNSLRAWDGTCGTQPVLNTLQNKGKLHYFTHSSAWLSPMVSEGWILSSQHPPASSRSWVPQNPRSGDRGGKAGAAPRYLQRAHAESYSGPTPPAPGQALPLGRRSPRRCPAKAHRDGDHPQDPSSPHPSCTLHPKCHGHTGSLPPP